MLPGIVKHLLKGVNGFHWHRLITPFYGAPIMEVCAEVQFVVCLFYAYSSVIGTHNTYTQMQETRKKCFYNLTRTQYSLKILLKILQKY